MFKIKSISLRTLVHSSPRRFIKSAHKPWLLHNFGFEQCDAYFVHEGGWKVSVKHETFLREVQAKLEPLSAPFDAAIVHLGGNELCLTYCEYLELASKIEDLAQWLLKNGLVKVIYVCELLTRPHPRGVSSETFETHRSAVNRYLDTLLENAGYIKPWKHQRIFNSPNDIFIYDGTHLNYIGMKKFYESLKRSIILAVEEAAIIQ